MVNTSGYWDEKAEEEENAKQIRMKRVTDEEVQVEGQNKNDKKRKTDKMTGERNYDRLKCH